MSASTGKGPSVTSASWGYRGSHLFLGPILAPFCISNGKKLNTQVD